MDSDMDIFNHKSARSIVFAVYGYAAGMPVNRTIHCLHWNEIFDSWKDTNCFSLNQRGDLDSLNDT